ncbi:MAG TPA: PQQ-binding-like beta-propeller repeat protein [Vicinamibacterales bacterium]
MKTVLRRGLGAGIALAVFALAGDPVQAQAREWTTAGFDAQRTGWVRTDPHINRESVEDGTFQFLWKHTFDNETRQLESLTQPVLQDRLIGYRGFKSLAFIGGAADRLFAIDTDLAKPYWTTHLTYAAATGSIPGSTWECPGGLLATPSRVTALVPSAFGGGGGGGGQRAVSAVGEPGKGAAVLSQPRRRRPAAPPSDPPPPPPPGPERKVEPVPFGGVDPLYAMGSDGMLRILRVSDGHPMELPVPFLPPNTRPSSLLAVDGYVYTTTSRGCGAAPNAVWVLDLLSPEKKVTRWETGGADVVGSSGVALGTSGLVYVATGTAPPNDRPWLGTNGERTKYASSVVALDRATLEPKDQFTIEGAGFNATPIVFRHKGRDLVVASADNGRLYLLDGAALGGTDGRTPLHVTPVFSGPGNGAGLATWQDREGTRWVLATAVGPVPAAAGFRANGPAENGSVVAFRLVEEGSSLSLQPAWQSPDLLSPLAPIVVNGLVFAAAGGEYRGPETDLPAAERAKRSRPAVLHALDAATGKPLWSSGNTITSFARAGLAAGGGQVYLVTYDNTLYAFGIPLEH